MAEPISNFTKETFDFVARNAWRADRVAQALGVSRNAVMGSIANEHDTRFNPDLSFDIRGGVWQGLADLRARQFTHEEIEKNYNSIKGGKTEFGGKLRNPAIIDVGPGNIKIQTAIEMLKEYIESNIYSDPLNLKKYDGKYDKLVEDLSSFVDTDATFAIAGLVIRKADQFFKAKDESAWNRLSIDQQDALRIMHYKIGPARLSKNLDDRIVAAQKSASQFDFNPRGDGGEQHLNNINDFNSAMKNGLSGGFSGDWKKSPLPKFSNLQDYSVRRLSLLNGGFVFTLTRKEGVDSGPKKSIISVSPDGLIAGTTEILDDGTRIDKFFSTEEGDFQGRQTLEVRVNPDGSRTTRNFDPASGSLKNQKVYDSFGKLISNIDVDSEREKAVLKLKNIMKGNIDALEHLADSTSIDEYTEDTFDEMDFRSEYALKLWEGMRHLTDIDAARVEAAWQEAERAEAARQEAERAEAARQEAARAEAARQEAARAEAARQEAARAEAARQEAARAEAARQEAARAEAARQEAARAEVMRREAAAKAERDRLAFEEARRQNELQMQRHQERLRQEEQARKESQERQRQWDLQRQREAEEQRRQAAADQARRDAEQERLRREMDSIRIPGTGNGKRPAPGMPVPQPRPGPVPTPRPNPPSQWRPGYKGFPVVMDMNGDGELDLRILPVVEGAEDSHPVFDWNGDGKRDATAWVGPSDGLLTIDLGADTGAPGPDGKINRPEEVAFSLWKSEEQRLAELKAQGIDDTGRPVTDLEGLRFAFDTNQDDILDNRDARWSEFRIWQDFNQNGTADEGELSTMEAEGIAFIDLLPSEQDAKAFPDGSLITGTSSAKRIDGTSILVGDVALAYRPVS